MLVSVRLPAAAKPENTFPMRSVRSVLILCLVFLLSVATYAAAADVSGAWTFTVELGMGTGRPKVILKQEGEKLTGTYDGRYGVSPLEGIIKENKIELTVSMTAEGQAVLGVFTGVVDGDSMSGSVEFDGAGDGTWTAVKTPAR
jgi:hypothetical protein